MNDQAPAADPALDALGVIEFEALLLHRESEANMNAVEHKAALIRAALADRITADEARTALDWYDAAEANLDLDTQDQELIARLGKIAEAGR